MLWIERVTPMAKRKGSEPAVLPPEPNARTIAAIDRARSRVLGRRRRVAVKVSSKGMALSISAPHSDESGQQYHLLDAFGTASHDFLNATVSQMIEALRDREGTPNETSVNAALAIVDGIGPENEMEALLASQMAATHALAMMLVGRTRRVDQLQQAAVNGGLAIKLLRTFTLQAETLAKLRRGGGQTVRVEHVHVHSGGQAIVGNVTGGGTTIKSEEQPHAKPVAALAHADAPFESLRSTDAERDRMPVASHA